MRLLRYGSDAVLVEVDSVAEVRSVHAALLAATQAGDLPGVRELVPAARTVLVAFAPAMLARGRLETILEETSTTRSEQRDGEEIVLPVHYDGEDLRLVADTAGLTVGQVIDLHTSASYTVAFCGFVPGFAYLTGLPAPLRQARLDTPRTRVRKGSVGVAGEFTGAYPKASPGGWRLLGHTTRSLFDPARTPPALLAPGDRVRIMAAR